jgi:exosortase/archaeosortase family protein
MAAELNARIGRTAPAPLFGTLVPGATPAQPPAPTLPAISPPALLLAALVAALWPHWVYVARRLTDGSDEPWGILALGTVLLLVARDRAQLSQPSAAALAASAALALVAAAADLVLPDLAAAAVAMLALGVFLMHALRRPAAALVVLLLLALPIVASLQFYLGYPLRVGVAHAASTLLTLIGVAADARGAAIVHDGVRVLIDAPCAGIGMLWMGSYAAALLSYLHGADARATFVNGVVAALLVLAANVLRNTLLFFPEAGLVHWPAAAHGAIGVAAFVAALVPLGLFIVSRSPQ